MEEASPFFMNGVDKCMEITKKVNNQRINDARRLVRDFISFFENEYGIRHDANGDFSLAEKPDEQIFYNWDGSVLSDLSEKEGV